MLNIPADEPELLEKGLHVLGEWAFGMVFDPDELERAVERMLRSYRQRWEERNTTDSSRYVQELTSHFLKDEAVPGIEFEWELVRQTLPEIALSEIALVSSQLIHQRAPVIVVTGPGKDSGDYPDESELLTWNLTGEFRRRRAGDPPSAGLASYRRSPP